jgi:Domain of unknown function (DUF4845)
MKAMKRQQRGLSMPLFLLSAVVLIFVVIGAMKLIPPYMENGQIKDLFNSVAHDPDLKDATIRDIQLEYAKRASVDNITAIRLNDIDIGKDDSGISLSASYQVKIPLVANITLVLDFNPSSQ